MNIEMLPIISVVLIFISIALIFVYIFIKSKPEKVRVEGGFVVWIGPFPIVGATNEKIALTILIVSTIIFLTLFFISKKLLL